MSNLTKEEYLKLVEKFFNEQYDEVPFIESLPNDAWIYADPPAKDKMKLPGHDGITDLTNVKKDKIAEILHTCRNIKIGNFLVKITKYHGEPDYEGGANFGLDICIYEEKVKSNPPSKIQYKVDVHKDTRFSGRVWIEHFNSFKIGANIPLETVVEIVRWLQAIKRMSAFL